MLLGATLPLFSVVDANGVARGTQPHWQRRDLLLLLAHADPSDPCMRVRDELRERLPRLASEQIAVVVLAEGLGPVPDGALPDPDGALSRSVREALGLEGSGGELIVATRFARVVHVLDAHAAPSGERVEEALEWLRYAQMACEDCSQPLWE